MKREGGVLNIRGCVCVMIFVDVYASLYGIGSEILMRDSLVSDT